MDILNIHYSQAVLRIIGEAGGFGIDLGIEGKRGILKFMSTRERFLRDPCN